MDFQQSRTYLNLQDALRYQLESSTAFKIYKKKADEDLLIPISVIFNTTSRNNRFIANYIRYLLYGETSTLENLGTASAMENEKIDVYREYSRIAREEGYDELASLFNGIANILFTHADSFDTAAFDLETGQLYCRTNEAIWICLGCGNVLTGECAPELCPICGVPGSFYQLVTYYE